MQALNQNTKRRCCIAKDDVNTFTIQTGAFNGSKGTIVEFAFTVTVPQVTTPTMASLHLCDDREIQTVFVKMEKIIGYSILSTIDSVIPFVAVTTEDVLYHKCYHRWQLPLATL